MRKNLSKRLLAVVATAAICCTVATPMTAKAINPGTSGVCTHSIMLLGRASEVLDTWTHSFSFHEDIDDDGYEELILEECTVEKVRQYEAYVCPYDDYSQEIAGGNSEIKETHSEANNVHHTYEE